MIRGRRTPPRANSSPRARRGRRFVGGVCAALAILVTAAPLRAPAATRARPVLAGATASAVGIADCTFIDPTRGVLNYSTTPASLRSAHRTLLVEIRYPTAGPATSASRVVPRPVARRGGYPTVLFAHGYDVTPDAYAALLNGWVAAGFVVVAPFFPDEKPSTIIAEGGANTEGDLVNEPADLAFVASRILQDSAHLRAQCPVVHGLIRPTQLALAGHSDGADAVALLAYGHGRDPHGTAYSALFTALAVRAVLVLAGAELPNLRYAAEARHPSLLEIQSAADTCNPIRQGLQLYRDVHQPNKWFLELFGAHHLPAFDGADAAAFGEVLSVSTRFLRSSLGVSQPRPGLEVYANRQPTIARMFDNQSGPSERELPTLVEACSTT